jgi:hypothetical protein
MEAIVALSITSMIIGALGFLLIYASRTLTQSFSDSTVQQQGVVALRKVSDDIIQSNIYSLYSVGNTYNPLPAAVGGLNVTFLSPYDVTTQLGSRIFRFGPVSGPPPPPYPLQFQSWVGYAVDAAQKLIRYDNDTAAPPPPFTPLPVNMTPLPAPALLNPKTVADMNTGAASQRSSHMVAKGIVIQDPSGAPVTTGFAANTVLIGGKPGAVRLTLQIQDYYGSGPNRFNQLNFTTQLYPRN